jgi:hypothetical protein
MRTAGYTIVWLVGLFVLVPSSFAQSPKPAQDGQQSVIATNPGPSAQQIQSLMTRAAANQHHNDKVIEEFDRVEHSVSRKSNGGTEAVTDNTERLLSSGTGTMHLRVKENGSPVPSEAYRRQLQNAVTALELANHPNERYRQDLAKSEKRRKDRAELVDEAFKAFHFTWAGRETRNGRTLVKFLMEPEPKYKPINRISAVFEHVRGSLWIDEATAQLARIEVDVASDISFGGGIIGKIYHGGHFVLEQSEITPETWLPTLYTYDMEGRKFLFGFSLHERTDVSGYRHVGPPSQSIEVVREELNKLSARNSTH